MREAALLSCNRLEIVGGSNLFLKGSRSLRVVAFIFCLELECMGDEWLHTISWLRSLVCHERDKCCRFFFHCCMQLLEMQAVLIFCYCELQKAFLVPHLIDI